MNKGLSWFVLILLIAGYFFLYGPILSLIIFSFNVSKLVTVWGGFSTKWYGALLNDRAIMDAAKHSVWIATTETRDKALVRVVVG
jgi:putrescine transport system permease protein